MSEIKCKRCEELERSINFIKSLKNQHFYKSFFCRICGKNRVYVPITCNITVGMCDECREQIIMSVNKRMFKNE